MMFAAADRNAAWKRILSSQRVQQRAIFPSSSVWLHRGLHAWQTRVPHQRQWCFRLVKEKALAQCVQFVLALSGSHARRGTTCGSPCRGSSWEDRGGGGGTDHNHRVSITVVLEHCAETQRSRGIAGVGLL